VPGSAGLRTCELHAYAEQLASGTLIGKGAIRAFERRGRAFIEAVERITRGKFIDAKLRRTACGKDVVSAVPGGAKIAASPSKI
jgi:hypothetical protein